MAEINTGLRELSIGTGGALNEVSGSPYAVGTGPTGVLLDATGSYVYVANKGSNNISAFTLTAASGKLTAVAGSPFSFGRTVADRYGQRQLEEICGRDQFRREHGYAATTTCSSLNLMPPRTESSIPSRLRLRAQILRTPQASQPRTRSKPEMSGMEPENNLVFVSIAAYRDPQLIPTIEDCLSKARNPEHLRFGICWQHGPGEITPPYQDDDRFRILDIAWRESQRRVLGSCRGNEVMAG